MGKAFRFRPNMHRHYHEEHPTLDFMGLLKRLTKLGATRKKREARGEVEERVEKRRRQTMSVRRHKPVQRVRTRVARRKVARGKVELVKGLGRRVEQAKVARRVEVVGSSSRRGCVCEGCKKENCGICVNFKDMKRYLKQRMF